MERPIIMYKKGEPTMIRRKDGSYVDNMEEWREIVSKLKRKSNNGKD